MRHLVAVLLILAASPVVPVLADPVTESVGSLPVEIVHLRLGGAWTAEDGTGGGYQRFIVARTVPGSEAARLFVQWIEAGVEGSPEPDDRVVATAEITELSEQPHRLSDLQVEVEEAGTTVHVDTVELTGGTVVGYTVFLEGPGVYEAGPASN